jgi:hypothetical protein
MDRSHSRKACNRKVMVVLFAVDRGRPHVVFVKHAQSGDWTFVSGGCKADESALDAGAREVAEETKNSILSSMDLSGRLVMTMPFSARHASRMGSSDSMEMAYTIVLINVTVDVEARGGWERVRQFYANFDHRKAGAEYSETDGIALVPLEECLSIRSGRSFGGKLSWRSHAAERPAMSVWSVVEDLISEPAFRSGVRRFVGYEMGEPRAEEAGKGATIESFPTKHGRLWVFRG